MNTFLAVIVLIAGLAVLVKGADWLVNGAVALAERLGISQLVIGMTIVAIGTSAPEVATSITAAVQNLGDTAIGNVYGSNIANLALVGGLCAIIRPINIKISILRRELPVMLIVALLLWPVMRNLHLSRIESSLLLGLFIALISMAVYMSRRQMKTNPAEVADIEPQIRSKAHRGKSLFGNIFFVLLGLAALAFGAHLVLEGAVFIGQKAGLSETVIGLSIIALCTSLPELITCIVAISKGHNDISIGNLIGSNVFNTLLVVGAAGLIRPFSINARLIGADYWVMIAVSFAFVMMAIFSKAIGRVCGVILVSSYVAYMVYVLIITPAT